MRILIVHNHYQFRGGEDVVFEQEVALLRGMAHEVEIFEESNERLKGMHPVRAFMRTLWSIESYKQISEIIRRFQPDVMHVHNTFPLISPSIYYAASRYRVPVVQTLHNYRLLCPNALLLRNGKVCEKCIHLKVPWPGVLYACYRESRKATVAVAAMLALHRMLGTWRRKVSNYIALSAFAKNKFIEGEMPASRVMVRPNFIVDPGFRPDVVREGGLFVGMLHPWKGCGVLLEAWAKCNQAGTLTIVGDGPQMIELLRKAGERVVFEGLLESERVMLKIQQASFLVFPSIWYEGMPRTILEAMACGTPVIASRIGSLPEIVKDMQTGLLFEPGNPSDLAAKIEWAFAHPEALRDIGHQARREYLSCYAPDKAASTLLNIYKQAIHESDLSDQGR